MNILGGFGIGVLTIGAGFIIVSSHIKNHAEKFRSDNATFVKQKLNLLLKELIIETISNGINKFDFLSKLLNSSQNPETNKTLEDFKNDMLLFLTERKELTGFKNHLSKIINKIIENPEGYQCTTKIASDFLIKINEYNSIEKNYESSYKLEIKESKNVFWFSIGFIIVGLTIVLYALYGTTLIQINSDYFKNLFLIIYVEGLPLAWILSRIVKIDKDKNKAQEEISKIEQESINISPIGNINQ